MIKAKVKNLTVTELVEQFLKMTLEQDDVLMKGRRIAIYNRLFDEINAVVDELKMRAGDQRIALLPLLENRNPQVKLIAAIDLLAVAYGPARRVLEELRGTDIFPQSANAAGLLNDMDKGLHVPK